MKERLLARVRADAAAGTVARRRIGPAPRLVWGIGLAAAASVVFGVVSVIQDVGLRSDLAATQRRTTALQTQLAQSQRVGAGDRRTLTDLVAPDAKRYDVAAGAVVVRHGHVYFAFSKLPALPRGRVYQAWTIAKGTTDARPQPDLHAQRRRRGGGRAAGRRRASWRRWRSRSSRTAGARRRRRNRPSSAP